MRHTAILKPAKSQQLHLPSPCTEQAGYGGLSLSAYTGWCSALRLAGTAPEPLGNINEQLGTASPYLCQSECTAGNHLAVFGAVGLCETLDSSFLTLSGLTDRTQLALHFMKLLLQLLQTEWDIREHQTHVNASNMRKLESNEKNHVVGLALLDLGLQGLDLQLGLLQLVDALTGCTLILVQLALLLLDKTLKVEMKEFRVIKRTSMELFKRNTFMKNTDAKSGLTFRVDAVMCIYL